MLQIYVDADACPVKKEVYRVAKRYELHVYVVANSSMRVPTASWVELVVVEDLFDAADDWIAEKIEENDILISEDVPLASRCLKKGARVLTPRGKVMSEDSIGNRLAVRDLLSHLRDIGEVGGGPPPIDARDRSRFLGRLDDMVQAIRRGK